MYRTIWSALAVGALCACDSSTPPTDAPLAPDLSPAATSGFHFRTTNLGKLAGGTFSVAFSINERSEAAGLADLPSGELRAVRWRNGTIRNLGTLGGSFSVGLGINDLGEVVGGANLRSDTVGHAFLWTPGQGMQDLGVLPGVPAFFGSEAHAINNRREVVGIAQKTASPTDRAFIWRPGRGLRSLGTLGGQGSTANGINDATQVVGSSLTRSGEEHAFLWTAAGGMKDLGTLGGSFSVALGISENGAVTGFSALGPDPEKFEAFLWTKGQGMRRLGSLGKPRSFGDGINSHFRVSGTADTSLFQTSYPSLWTREHGMQRLPTLIGFRGDGFGEAWSINEFGVMAGISRDTKETVSGTMWTPVAGPLTAASEPGSGEPDEASSPAAAASVARLQAAICRVTARRAPQWSHLRQLQARRCPA